MRVMSVLKILLPLVVLLSGCARPEYTDGTISQYEILNKKQALLVAKISVPYKDLFNRDGSHSGFIIIRNIKDKYYIDGSSYATSAIMVKPGLYEVYLFGWNDGAYKYMVKVESKLDANPGDCIYLGDITLLNKKDFPSIRIDNNLQSAINGLNTISAGALTQNLKFYKLNINILRKQ